MDTFLLLARLLLAAVFAVAGIAKLVDRDGSREAMRAFGVPARLAAPFGLLLPVLEVVTAVALLPTSTARWGALGALALLLVFIAGISVSLARGEHPDCHCFGQLHSAPAGWPTLARNGILAALAAFLLWQGWADPGASTIAWLGDLSTGETVALLAALLALAMAAVEGWVLFHLISQNGRLLVLLDELEARGDTLTGTPGPAVAARRLGIGTVAPTFALAGLDGETLTLDLLRASGKPVLLVFSDPGCGPCSALMPEIGRWQREHANELTVAIVSHGPVEANQAKVQEHGPVRLLLQHDREVAEAYGAQGTPSAVVINPDGTIGSPLAMGAESIRALVAQAVGAPNAAPLGSQIPVPVHTNGANGHAAGGNGGTMPAVQVAPLQVGDAVPPLRLPDLDGTEVDVSAPAGDRTLLLFWNPGCGFCQRMLSDLKAWEAAPPQGAPKLLVVSQGDVDANRAQGLQAPVVLDQTFGMGRTFGARGTPSAVLVDGAGRVASEVAVGAPAVLALARTDKNNAPSPTN